MPTVRNSSNITKYFLVAAIILSFLVVYFYFLGPSSNLDSSKGAHASSSKRECKPTIIEKYVTPSTASNCPPVTPCQCYDANAAGPAQDGQVHMGTTFGKALNNLAKQSDVNLFLEIGTWFGGGSTQCIASGLRDSGSHKLLYTLEMFEPAWAYARKKYNHMPIRFILGGTVPKEEYLKDDEIPQEEKTDHYKLYYHRDLQLADLNEPWLKPLCLLHKFDAVLIDGNEYTGWAEYNVVKTVCKPKYLALHDVGTLKTRKIEAEISTQSNIWKKLECGADNARWCIFERIAPYE